MVKFAPRHVRMMYSKCAIKEQRLNTGLTNRYLTHTSIKIVLLWYWFTMNG